MKRFRVEIPTVLYVSVEAPDQAQALDRVVEWAKAVEEQDGTQTLPQQRSPHDPGGLFAANLSADLWDTEGHDMTDEEFRASLLVVDEEDLPAPSATA